MQSKNNFVSITYDQILIGVTGHRDNVLTDYLKRSIRRALTEEIQKVIPKNKKIVTRHSYKIITPLADGADRIVAIEAMELLNAEMEVILPFRKEEYKETFFHDVSREEFEQLLLKAKRIETLIKVPLTVKFPGKELSECRQIAYKNVGNAVIDNCDILIALWDGVTTNKVGGTADIVNTARAKGKTIIIISSETPHRISIEKGNNLIRDKYYWIALFNNYRITDEDKISYENNIAKDLFVKVNNVLNQTNIKLVKENLLPFYVRASVIAKKYQSLFKSTGISVFVLSPLAVAAVALSILFLHYSSLFFLIELVLLSTIISLIIFADRYKAHAKWIKNRFLAERIRCAIFFIICGFKPKQVSTSTYYKKDWTFEIYEEIIKSIDVVPGYDHGHYPDLLEYINVNWIKKQISFHQKVSERSRKNNKILETCGWLVFISALIAAAIHLFVGYTGIEFKHPWISDYIIFAAITLPALGASLEAIRNHREYARTADRSEKMVKALNELLKESESVKSLNELENYLSKIENVMLSENQDWIELMKFVKLEAI